MSVLVWLDDDRRRRWPRARRKAVTGLAFDSLVYSWHYSIDSCVQFLCRGQVRRGGLAADCIGPCDSIWGIPGVFSMGNVAGDAARRKIMVCSRRATTIPARGEWRARRRERATEYAGRPWPLRRFLRLGWGRTQLGDRFVVAGALWPPREPRGRGIPNNRSKSPGPPARRPAASTAHAGMPRQTRAHEPSAHQISRFHQGAVLPGRRARPIARVERSPSRVEWDHRRQGRAEVAEGHRPRSRWRECR